MEGRDSSGHVTASIPPKDPVLMAVLSGCCIAGLGQIILGQVTKGVVILLGSIALGAVTMGVSVFVTWPLGAIDAYMIAKKLKEGRIVGQWEFF
jgi:TM2 domain-containing membrane protein YozV